MKLEDVVVYNKLTKCASCDSHEYTLPFPITKEIEQYIVWSLGPLKFPLSRIKVIKIDNMYFQLQGRVGLNSLRVKYQMPTLAFPITQPLIKFH